MYVRCKPRKIGLHVEEIYTSEERKINTESLQAVR